MFIYVVYNCVCSPVISLLVFIYVVTEEEMDCAGLLSDGDEDQKSKCLVFTRNINNINSKHERARKFIDMTDSKVDDEKKGFV